jgi:hypothetical protein
MENEKSPVKPPPEPEYDFEADFGATNPVSPKTTVPPDILTILKGPAINDGIRKPPYDHPLLLGYEVNKASVSG